MKMPLSVVNENTVIDNEGITIAVFIESETAGVMVDSLNMLYSKRDILRAIPHTLNSIKDNSEINVDPKNDKRIIRNPDYLAFKAYANIIQELSEVKINAG